MMLEDVDLMCLRKPRHDVLQSAAARAPFRYKAKDGLVNGGKSGKIGRLCTLAIARAVRWFRMHAVLHGLRDDIDQTVTAKQR